MKSVANIVVAMCLVVAGCASGHERDFREMKAVVNANVTIDFGAKAVHLDPRAIGMAETGYQAPNVLANDPLEQQMIKRLGLGAMRIPLAYSVSGDPSSKIVCASHGCDLGPDGDHWISAIRGTGAEPIVVVNTKSAVDASNLVAHFNIDPRSGRPNRHLANYVRYWIIGNEPNTTGYSSSSYSGYFNADALAMKAVDPNVRLAGPGVAWYDPEWIRRFLLLSGSLVDVVDFHGYPQQGNATGRVPALFGWATSTGRDVSGLRNLVNATVPARASSIQIEVGEWSLNWGGNAQGDTNFNAVWTADVLGNILQNGGLSLYFGSKGNALKWANGTNTDDLGHAVFMRLDDPKAPYQGYGMFTGAGLFRSFGRDMVRTTTTLPGVDVFASTNPKNIVVINRNQFSAQNAVFSLNVASGSVAVWQKNQTVLFTDPPVRLAPARVRNGAFTYPLPPMSVTTFIVR